MKIIVGISNRHIHLTEETYNKLFDKDLTIRNYLKQPGQFAADETLTISVGNNKIDNVRIIGPLRNYDQVEICKSDAYILGINPPIKTSGDLDEALAITLCNGHKSIELKRACIIANRHIHISSADANKFGIKDKQKIQINISGEKSGIIDVFAKVNDSAELELHLDRDDSNAFLLKSGDEVEWKI